MDKSLEINNNYEWVLRTIRISATEFHIESCRNMIEIFKKNYPKHINMADILEDVLRKKQIEINELWPEE